MRQLMEYKIISGPVEEIRQVMMTSGRNQTCRRGQRIKGRTSLRKIMANERESIKRLTRLINCNFGPGDLWLVLRYSDERLPADIAEAKRTLDKFLRKMREQFQKETGRKLRYIVTTSNTSTKTGEPVRLHHHIVMDRLTWEFVIKYWPVDQVSYVIIDGRRDYAGIARYMCRNTQAEMSMHRWSASQGLKKPIYTEPVPARGQIKLPKGAVVKEKAEFFDEETGAHGAYIRYIRLEVIRR